MNLLFALFAWLTSISVSNGARILALVPVNSRSHFKVMEPFLLELHSRGHHLTVVSAFPQKRPLENLTDIDFSNQLRPPTNQMRLEIIQQQLSNLYESSSFIIQFHLNVCREVLGSERALSLINEKFDIVIGEIFGADCLNYFSYKLKVPLISWITSDILPWAAERTGLPDNPSYIPNYFVSYSPEMTLYQRISNTVYLYLLKTLYYYSSELPARKMAESFLGEELPTIAEINRLTSLTLVNSHFSLSQSRPFTPNVIEVAGVHIKDAQPLPEDLGVFLDSAKEGVILMSFGSLVRVSSLPPRVIRMFLDVFATLPQKVILKYEEDLPGVPPNVMYMNWLPQSDIIAHPNVRAVISHGGLASTIEAVHFAKPMVAIPFYGDQFKNAQNVAYRGAGILLHFDRLSKQDISQALKAVLENERYSENMRQLSQQFRDRPMTPLQTAVYWTEYVIRHKGASHLRPASVSLPLYQYLLLDVVAVLTISVVIFLFIAYAIFHRIYVWLNIFIKKQRFYDNKKIN